MKTTKNTKQSYSEALKSAATKASKNRSQAECKAISKVLAKINKALKQDRFLAHETSLTNWYSRLQSNLPPNWEENCFDKNPTGFMQNTQTAHSHEDRAQYVRQLACLLHYKAILISQS
jgi:hypothetical protein